MLAVGDRVMLTDEARASYLGRDIGLRAGTVQMIDGWPVVQFDGMAFTTRLPETKLRRIGE